VYGVLCKRSCNQSLGITYSKSTSQDSRLQSNALPTELKSDQAVRVGVGAVTDVRGAVLTAPQAKPAKVPTRRRSMASWWHGC
jgi:hypothetical protein